MRQSVGIGHRVGLPTAAHFSRTRTYHSPRAKDAVAAMIKRLAHRNANVQLYTLEVRTYQYIDKVHGELTVSKLANALSQNCGVDMHRELASRSFTDAMLRLANDRVREPTMRYRGQANGKSQTTHQQVKSKIVERMGEWTTMFRQNPELGIMEQAYMKLKSQSRLCLAV